MNVEITKKNYYKFYFKKGKNCVRIFKRMDDYFTIEYLAKETFFGGIDTFPHIMDTEITLIRAVALLHSKGYTEVEPLFKVEDLTKEQ